MPVLVLFIDLSSFRSRISSLPSFSVCRSTAIFEFDFYSSLF